MNSRPTDANLTDDDRALMARIEIEALAASCAYAMDAICGRDVEGGRQIIRTCFTADAKFTTFLPGSDPKGPPARSSIGPDAWVDAGTALHYAGTQYHMGNFRINVHGDTATMTSYFTAVLVIHWSSSIEFTTGTYTDHLVHTPNGWRIARRRLDLTSHLRLESPASKDLERNIDSLSNAHRVSGGGPKPETPDAVAPRPTYDWSLIKAHMELKALSTTYGYAADAIGRGDLDEGRRLWRACFMEDGQTSQRNRERNLGIMSTGPSESWRIRNFLTSGNPFARPAMKMSFRPSRRSSSGGFR